MMSEIIYALLATAVAIISVLCVLVIWLKFKQVRIANERLRQMVDAISELNIMLIFDGNGELKSVNKAFTTLYGLSEDEFVEKVGYTLSDYVRWCGFCYFDSKAEKTSFVGKSIGNDNKNIWKQVTITRHVDAIGDVRYMAVEFDITNVKETEIELQKQQNRSDALLQNMLPAEIVEELKVRERAKPRVYNSASVLFADIKNFTQWSERLEPKELIDTLQVLFSDFDDVLTQNFIEKIKTVGDAYMCAGGVPMKNKSHPFDIVIAAFGLQNAVRRLGEKRMREGGEPWQLRIGINTGMVVTGVVGKIRTTYDIWGDAVNVASRLESECEPGKINISKSTYEVIKDYFECEYRGKIPAKHKGEIDMYFVNRLKPEYSADKLGFIPNEAFRLMLSKL